MSLISTTTTTTNNNKQPTKSILKQANSNSNTSWFSKFNNIDSNNTTTNTNSGNTTPPISPRINSLFNSFRKQPQQQQQPAQQLQQKQSIDDFTIISQLGPKELKRVRFPVNDMTREYLFMREDLVTEKKKQVDIEPINIQTSGQLLSLYELLCRKKQEPTIDLLVSTLIVNIAYKSLNILTITSSFP
jgi:hypothetical protein